MDRLIPDIPRLYTGIAEWLGCMTVLIICPRKFSNIIFAIISACALALQCAFLMITRDAPSGLAWIACMAAAVFIMFGFITVSSSISLKQSAYCTAVAFLFAECAAAFEWQLHTWFSFTSLFNKAASVILLVLVYGLVFFTAYRTMKNQLTAEYLSRLTDRDAWTAVLIAVITFAFSNISFYLDNTPFSGQVMVDIFTIRTLVDICGLAILYIFQNRLSELTAQKELASLRYVLNSQYEQYRYYRESEEMLYMLQHDLKHQIEGLRGLDNEERRSQWIDLMEDKLDEWWIPHRTGNPVFDTILAAKLRKARTLDIRITCVVNGALLDMLHVTDICTIFGNAIDNAMESVAQIKEPERRLIHISVSSQKNFIFISVANILKTEILEKDGSLLTTKADKKNHGYGMKGIKYVVDKYGGNVSYRIDKGWFELNILIPCIS